MATIAAGPAREFVGDLRISGSVLRGTRTEWLPFPCHPRDRAFLADLDPSQTVQYWEQTCRTDGCGIQYRFEHNGRHIRWHPIVGLTDAVSPQALPLDRSMVEARLRRETGANPVTTAVGVTSGGDAPDHEQARRLSQRLTTAHS